MYLTRNQAGVYSASGVRIPPSPPDMIESPREGAFLCFLSHWWGRSFVTTGGCSLPRVRGRGCSVRAAPPRGPSGRAAPGRTAWGGGNRSPRHCTRACGARPPSRPSPASGGRSRVDTLSRRPVPTFPPHAGKGAGRHLLRLRRTCRDRTSPGKHGANTAQRITQATHRAPGAGRRAVSRGCFASVPRRGRRNARRSALPGPSGRRRAGGWWRCRSPRPGRVRRRR